MKTAAVIALLAFGTLLIYASTGLPLRGDPAGPSHKEETAAGTTAAATYYIRNAGKETKTPNIVTAILADYRSFDTLGEVVVVLTAGLCCYLILRKQKI